jgi:hypothetical protein
MSIHFKKELAKCNIKIKTLNKVAKESDAEHNKIIKKKDNTIKNLLHYKTLKTSEETELKVKDKKINKKLKSLGEREAKLLQKPKTLNIQNNNEITKSPIYPCSPISLPPPTNYSNCV